MSFSSELVEAASQVFDQHISRGRKVAVLSQPYKRPCIPAAPSPDQPFPWPEAFQLSIDNALNKAWAPSTTKLYNRAIQSFLAFCQCFALPKNVIFPASDYLLCAFVASQPPSTSKSTIKNLLSGIRAWHVRNGFTFIRSDRLNLLCKIERPIQNKKPLRPPVSVEMLNTLATTLAKDDPADACILACASAAFWGLARLGEFLPESENSFDPSEPPFPTVQDFASKQDDSVTIHLPWTKTQRWKGEDLIISRQLGETNSAPLLLNHIAVNGLRSEDFLFSYIEKGDLSILTKTKFLTRCRAIWTQARLPTASGHSFRIGGTSHLLLCGVNPDVIKKAGRWSSDSFLRYWRNLETVIPVYVSDSSFTERLGDPRQGLGWGSAKDVGLASSSRGPSQGAR